MTTPLEQHRFLNRSRRDFLPYREEDCGKPSLAGYQGISLVSRAIEKWTLFPYSHVAWVCADGSTIGMWFRGGCQHTPSVSHNHTPGTRVDLFTIEGLTPSLRAKVEARLLADVRNGVAYDFAGVMGFIRGRHVENLVKLFCSEQVFTRCSEEGLWLLERCEGWQLSPGQLLTSPLVHHYGTVVTGNLSGAEGEGA